VNAQPHLHCSAVALTQVLHCGVAGPLVSGFSPQSADVVVSQRGCPAPPHFQPRVGPEFVVTGSCCATTSLYSPKTITCSESQRPSGCAAEQLLGCGASTRNGQRFTPDHAMRCDAMRGEGRVSARVR
jgi:hypothetical protein